MYLRWFSLVLTALFLLSGCADAPKPRPAPPKADGNVAKVKVFFATDRNTISDPRDPRRFGGERSEELKYGYCVVSIPREDRKGDSEATALWELEFNDKLKKDVTLTDVVVTPRDRFLKDLSARIQGSEGENALLFVHGYSVPFEDAAVSTAKLAYDLSFDGGAAFYSWPSKGEKSEYFADGSAIEWSTPHLKAFLQEFISKTDAENVYIIAHSMGNRGVTRALMALYAESPKLFRKIKEIVLAAPDIDAGVFRDEIAPALVKTGRPVTLYASADDLALALSQRVHSFPRAGNAGDGLVIVKGIETVDVNDADTSFLKHSYVTSNRTVLTDLYYIVHQSLRADKRAGLYGVETDRGRYWKIRK